MLDVVERFLLVILLWRRKESIWTHWVIFAFAVALIGISSHIIDRNAVNSSASCESGSEEDCASLSACSFEVIGVGDAALNKLLTIIGLVCIVTFTIVFLIPVDESE